MAEKRQLRRWAVAVFAFLALAAQGVDMPTLILGAAFILIATRIGDALDHPGRTRNHG